MALDAIQSTSSRTAPRQEVSENLEEAKSPRRVYSESVRSRDSDATRESKEFFAFLNSYEGKTVVGIVALGFIFISSFPQRFTRFEHARRAIKR